MEASMLHPLPSQRQIDLFAPHSPRIALPKADLTKLLPLVSLLLTETVVPTSATEIILISRINRLAVSPGYAANRVRR